MGIDQRIPDLSDKELEILYGNAVRLAESGTAQQRQQAEALLPLLRSELDQRRAAHATTQSETRRRKVAAGKVVKAKTE